MDDPEYETRRRTCRRTEGDCCDLSCFLVLWLILSALPAIASDGPSLAANAFGIIVACLPAFLVLSSNAYDHATKPEYSSRGLAQFVPVYAFMVLAITAAILATVHTVLSFDDSDPLPCLLIAAGAVAYYAAFPFALTADLETDLVFAAVIAVHVHRGFVFLPSLYAMLLAMAIWNRVLA